MFKRCRLLWWHFSRQHICPGDIYSYIQYLSFLLVQFWPNFLDPIFFGSWFLQTKMFLGKTSSDPHFFNANFFFQSQNVRAHSFYTRNSIGPQKKIKLNFFLPQIFSDLKFFQTQNIFGPKIFLNFFFQMKFFCTYNIFQKFSSPKIFFPKNLFEHKHFFSDPKFFTTQNF